MEEPSAERLVGMLADDDRLAVVAALALGASDEAAVVAATGLTPDRARKALERLAGGGLVARTSEGVELRRDLFRQAARSASTERRRRQPSPEDLGATPEQAGVLRNFLVDGRLRGIPSTAWRRRLVLDFLAGRFEPGRVYPERDVNAELARFHDDVAALRRYLVDDGFLERRDAFYWRAGGTFEVE
ncbi:MAG TPA: DUF2087 domain-containing protein [Acidimicrobiales bacterium]|nr:DUF2087 domain-containing protein [Acidimicrobiales bacterium]